MLYIKNFLVSLIVFGIGVSIYYASNYIQLFLFNVNIIFFIDLPCALLSYIIYAGAPSLILKNIVVFSGVTIFSRIFGFAFVALILFLNINLLQTLISQKDIFYIVLTAAQVVSLLFMSKNVLLVSYS